MDYNPDSQFYIYSKGWHKRSEDKMADLKKLQAEYANVDAEFIHDNDVLSHLLDIVWYEISTSGNPAYKFNHFISNELQYGIIDACLSMLAVAPSGNCDRLPLDKPSTVLPLANGSIVDLWE